MIRFACPQCARILTVSEGQAGKTGQCPGCRGRITIPSAAVTPDLLPRGPSPTNPVRAGASSQGPEANPPAPTDALDGRLLDLPPMMGRDASKTPASDQEVLAKLKFKPPPEYTGVRQLPWPIDILLYPLNATGLLSLAVLIGVPAVLAVLQHFALPFLDLMFYFPKVALGICAVWYWSECIYDSAQGGTRAPQILDSPGYSDKWSRVCNLLAVHIVFVLPAVLYTVYTGRRDAFLWVLVAWGVFFFPMGLLAIVMQDGRYVLNPLFLLGSIGRTFVPYLGLLLLIATPAALFALVLRRTAREGYALDLAALALLTGGYLSLVVAHLLGRFYWRHRERLHWDL